MIQTLSMSHTGNLMGSLFPQKEVRTEASVLIITAVCFYTNKTTQTYEVPWLVRNQVLPKQYRSSNIPAVPVFLRKPGDTYSLRAHLSKGEKKIIQGTSDDRSLFQNQGSFPGNILPTAPSLLHCFRSTHPKIRLRRTHFFVIELVHLI